MRLSSLPRFSLLLLSLTASACSDDMESAYPGGGVYLPPAAVAPTLPGDLVAASGFVETSAHPLSTFSIDVDTGSYSLARSLVKNGTVPPVDAVRAEEFLNYFDYGDAPPSDGRPFAVHLEGAPSAFGEQLSLLRVALKGREVPEQERAQANLVFLVDVSGSMQDTNKLPLVKYTLHKLVAGLRATDTLGLVVYAGADRVVLEPTSILDKAKVDAAIDQLNAGGSTNGEAGIKKAYALAETVKTPGSINRVVLCTDGDFNVGLTGSDLISLIEKERDTGITLTTLGFGSGNYQDGTMESLADHGNGNYAYIDSEEEALRVVGKNLVGTIQVIAKDTKIQIAFDPSAVKRYRLIGYENRKLANQDFRNDAKDAGEMGPGHTVVALYEAELVPDAPAAADLATVQLRYKEPEAATAVEFSLPFSRSLLAPSFAGASNALRFGAAVVEFAEILGKSPHSSGARFDDVVQIAGASSPRFEADKADFIAFASKAKSIWKN